MSIAGHQSYEGDLDEVMKEAGMHTVSFIWVKSM